MQSVSLQIKPLAHHVSPAYKCQSVPALACNHPMSSSAHGTVPVSPGASVRSQERASTPTAATQVCTTLLLT